MNKNILKNRKAILSAALVIAATASAFAQGNGIAGINEATSMVSSYFDPGTKLIYAIGAVVGLLGLVLLLSPGGGLVVITWAIGLAALVVGAHLVFFALQLRRLQRGVGVRRL